MAYWRYARQRRAPGRSRATCGHEPSAPDVRRGKSLDRPRNAATPRGDVVRPARGVTPRLRDAPSCCASCSYRLLCDFRTDSDGDRFEDTGVGRNKPLIYTHLRRLWHLRLAENWHRVRPVFPTGLLCLGPREQNVSEALRISESRRKEESRTMGSGRRLFRHRVAPPAPVGRLQPPWNHRRAAGTGNLRGHTFQSRRFDTELPDSASSGHWITGAESTTIWQSFRNTGVWRAACPLMSAERRATRRMRHCSSSNGKIFRLRSITRPSCISFRWHRPASSTSEPVSEPTLLRLRRWGIRS